MAAFDDYLTNVANADWGSMTPSNSFSFGAASPAYVDPTGKPVDPNAANEVEPLEVEAPPPPPAPIHYNNTDDVQALQRAQADAPRVDGGTNRGLWGLLPQGVQHGALRDVLGAMGDAFLMHAGQPAMYQNRVDNRTIGQAMAGYANNPQAAIERVAATGAPGSIKMANDLQDHYGNLELRKQIQDQNNIYRQQMMQSRNDQAIQRLISFAGAQVQGIRDPAQYKAMYDRLDARVKQIDPKADAATSLMIPTPDEFTAGSTGNAGMTGGQVAHRETSLASIQERRDAANQASADRRRGQNMATARSRTVTNINMNAIKQRIQDGTASDTDKAVWNRYLHGTKGGGLGLHASTTGAPVPTQSDIAYLKAHPQVKAQFEAHFGRGSASRYGIN